MKTDDTNLHQAAPLLGSSFRFLMLLVTLLPIQFASGIHFTGEKQCGYAPPAHDAKDEMDQTYLTWKRDQQRRLSAEEPEQSPSPHPSNFTIPTHFFVLANSNETAMVYNETLRDRMMRVLNYGFRGSAFQFEAVSEEVIVNKTLYASCSKLDNETGYYFIDPFASERRRGNHDELNIFVCNSRDYLGLAGLPTYELGIDTVILKHWKASKFERAYKSALSVEVTLIHEVGHWLGLTHTFEKGCHVHNDLIEDTAPHESFSYLEPGAAKCFRKQEYPNVDAEPVNPPHTCPILTVLTKHSHDPIDNYMNYIDDNCMELYGEFTPDQKDYMLAQYLAHRYVPPRDPSITSAPEWRVWAPYSSLVSPYGWWSLQSLAFYSSPDCDGTSRIPLGDVEAGVILDSGSPCADWDASRAFDAEPKTFWTDNGNLTRNREVYIGIDFGKNVTVQCVIINQPELHEGRPEYATAVALQARQSGHLYWTTVLVADNLGPGENRLHAASANTSFEFPLVKGLRPAVDFETDDYSCEVVDIWPPAGGGETSSAPAAPTSILSWLWTILHFSCTVALVSYH